MDGESEAEICSVSVCVCINAGADKTYGHCCKCGERPQTD